MHHRSLIIVGGSGVNAAVDEQPDALPRRIVEDQHAHERHDQAHVLRRIRQRQAADADQALEAMKAEADNDKSKFDEVVLYKSPLYHRRRKISA